MKADLRNLIFAAEVVSRIVRDVAIAIALLTYVWKIMKP